MITVTGFFIAIFVSTFCLKVIPFVRYATLAASFKVSFLFWLVLLPYESIVNSLFLHLGTSMGIFQGTALTLLIGILYPVFSLRFADRCIEDFEIETFGMTVLTVFTLSSLSLATLHGLGLTPTKYL